MKHTRALPVVLCAIGWFTLALRAQTDGPSPLEADKPLERQLAAGQSHEYSFVLKAGQYAKVVVEQRSAVVKLAIFGPDQQLMFEIGGSAGSTTRVEIVTEQSGSHRVVITSKDATGAAGDYAISITDVQEATDQLKERAAASRALAQSNMLAGVGTREASFKQIDALQTALVHWRTAGDRAYEALTLYSIGLIYGDIGEKERALKYATDALPVARSSGDTTTEAWALDILGLITSNFGDRRKGIEYFEQSLPLMRSSGDRSGEGSVLNNLGMAYAYTGELRRALDHFNQAVPIFTAIHDYDRLPVTFSNIGVMLGDLGDYPQALESHQRSLALLRQTGNRSREAITLNNMGTAYSSMADYQNALNSFRAALEIQRSLGRDWNVAINMHNVAWVHANLGDKQRARALYEEALEGVRKVKDQSGMSNTLNNLAEIVGDLGDYKKALEYHNEALALRQAIGDKEGQAASFGNIGKTYAKLGERDRAREQFEAALPILRETGNRRRIAGVLLSYGIVLRQDQAYPEAIECLEEALTINREIRDSRGEAETLAELARLERDRGDVQRAHERASEALTLLESLRLKVASPNLRAFFFATAQDLQEMDIGLLMRLDSENPTGGFGAAALLGSERSRARSLLELLGESGTEIGRGADAALTAREQELVRLVFAKAERQTRLLSGKSTSPEAAGATKDLNSLTAELEDVQSRIRQASPQYAALTQPVPLNLKQIQEQVLDPDTVLLEYSLGAEKSFLWAVTNSSVDIYELPPRASIETSARRVYQLLTVRNTSVPNETPVARTTRIRHADEAYFAAAKELSETILAPAAERIRNKRLLIVADGALQYIPFASLPEPVLAAGPPMMVNHEIVAAPSASVVAVMRRETAGRRPAAKALAVLADPVFSAGDARVVQSKTLQNVAKNASRSEDLPQDFVRLRFSRTEAEEIARLAPAGATLKALDFDASRDTVLKSELAQYRIIHFATHSILNNEHPELSGVVLSQFDRSGQKQNGFLRLYDIYNLRLGSDLVVLSACETALGGEIKGEGLIGLTRGFLYAGAPRVVATLWKIDDRATAEVMKRFYTAMLGRGERPAEALRSAQTEMWKAKGWENPYYWAAYTLQGEWR